MIVREIYEIAKWMFYVSLKGRNDIKIKQLTAYVKSKNLENGR